MRFRMRDVIVGDDHVKGTEAGFLKRQAPGSPALSCHDAQAIPLRQSASIS